jgi:polysaccharide export outer membrane protein
MNKIHVLYFFYVVTTLFLASCSTKKYVYLYEENYNIKDTLEYKPVKTNYQVQTNDILFITFHSVLSDAENFFKYQANIASENNLQLSEGELYINQYVVSDSGNIKIPVLGKILVSGQSIATIESNINLLAKKYISDVSAKVKLVNYKITFIGEFGNPGEKYFYRDRVNIMDALAVAGDITYYGDRQNLRILRNTPEGIKSFRINMNDINLLNSKDYYLLPNDIVYAEPLPRRIFRLQTSDYSIFLVAISSTLALVSIILNAR